MHTKLLAALLSALLAGSGPAAASQQGGRKGPLPGVERAGNAAGEPLERLDVQTPLLGDGETAVQGVVQDGIAGEARTEVAALTERAGAVIKEGGDLATSSPAEAHATGQRLVDLGSSQGADAAAVDAGPEEVSRDAINAIPSAEIQAEIASLKDVFDGVFREAGKKIVGQEEVLRTVLQTFAANGHVVLEGVPGTAKTLMAETLAWISGLKVQVIPMTPDLTPADLIGTRVYDPGTREWSIVTGPMLEGNIIILDELNRGQPKTKSAVLRPMQERMAKIFKTVFSQQDGSFPKPYLVIATMNPLESEGVNPLVEAEKDRFLAHRRVKYPTFEEELRIGRESSTSYKPELEQLLSGEKIIRIQELVRRVYIEPNLEKYITTIVRATRPTSEEDGSVNELIDLQKKIRVGAGPRGTINIMLAARARAAIEGRWSVTVDDIQAVAKEVLRLRVLLEPTAKAQGFTVDKIIDAIISRVNPYDPLGEEVRPAPAPKGWLRLLKPSAWKRK